MSLECSSSTAGPSASIELPTVSVVDSDATSRKALEVLIASAGWRPRMSTCAEEFLARPCAATPGCLVMDLHLPDLSGLDLRRLVLDRTELPVIFLSGQSDIPTAVQAMKSGAFDVLAKPCQGDVLLNTISHAIEHSRTALRRLIQVRTLQERYGTLSRRQQDVLRLIVSGRLNKQVGSELGITETTVKAHRGKVMRKMRAKSFADLVSMAARLEESRQGDIEYEVAQNTSSRQPSTRTSTTRSSMARVRRPWRHCRIHPSG